MESSRNATRKDAVRNRATIIDAARTAFGEHGPEVPVATIARIAGVGTATVYRHFPTRDALVTAMLADQVAHCVGVLDAAVQDPDAWSGFVRSLEALVDMEVANPGLTPVIAAQRETIPSYRQLWEHATRGLGVLAGRLRDSGTVRTDFGASDIVLVITALRAVAVSDPGAAPAQVRRLLHHLTHGIARPGTTLTG